MKRKLAWAGLILIWEASPASPNGSSMAGGVDADGVLQESFFLPLSFLLGIPGMLLLLVAVGMALFEIARR